MINKDLFKSVTKLVIDKLEGGYYNPTWHSTGDARYSTSGETMFGIDRKQGGNINTSAAGVQFWSLIDQNKTQSVWHWNFIPNEPLKSQLIDLVAEMMYPTYNGYANYSMSEQLKSIVENDARLLFHFIYAAWNGAGWFLKWSHDMDAAIKNGTQNANDLVSVAINSRTKEGYTKGSPPNSLIAQGGAKIASFINSIPSMLGIVEQVATAAVADVEAGVSDTVDFVKKKENS